MLSYYHRRKVCPGLQCWPVLLSCDWILCSERQHLSNTKALSCPGRVALHRRCQEKASLTLFLLLLFRFGVSSSKSSSSRKASPFSSASRTLYKTRQKASGQPCRPDDSACPYKNTCISSKVSSSLQRLLFFSSTLSPLRSASKAVASPGGTSRFGASSASKEGPESKTGRLL